MKTAQLALLLSSGWHPRKLIKGTDTGTVLNPSNLPSMFQESGGSTAGATGSAVGLMLDEQYALARNGELAPAFVVGGTGWTVSNNDATHVITFGAGSMRFQADTAATVLTLSKPGILTVGKMYEVSVVVSAAVRGEAKVVIAAEELVFSSVGAFTKRLVANTTDFVLYRNSADVDLTLSSISVREIPGNHALQGTAGSRPALAVGGKIDYDGVDDSLVVTFPADMGTACTVGRSVPQGEATILTGQTITTTYTDNTDHCGLVIINRALSATETNQLRRWLNRRAG